MKKHVHELLRISPFSLNSARSFCLISLTYGANFFSSSFILSIDMGLLGKPLSSNGILCMFFFDIFNIKHIKKENPNVMENKWFNFFIFHFKLSRKFFNHFSSITLARVKDLSCRIVTQIYAPTKIRSPNGEYVLICYNYKLLKVLFDRNFNILKRKSRSLWMIVNNDSIPKLKKVFIWNVNKGRFSNIPSHLLSIFENIKMLCWKISDLPYSFFHRLNFISRKGKMEVFNHNGFLGFKSALFNFSVH